MTPIAAQILALLLFTADSSPQMLKPGYRQVALDPSAQTHQEEVRGAPFTLTALVLPEPYTQATCGNCTAQTGPQPENWYMQLAAEEKTVYLKPTRLPDAAHPVPAFNTTLHITLASGYRININLGLADVYGSKPPDAEVAFVLPQKATLSGRLAEEVAKREVEYKERLEQESLQRFLEHLLGEVRCQNESGRPYVTDKVYIRLRQTCKAEASPATYWAVFEVTNRASSQVQLGSASLLDANATGMGGEKTAFRFERSTLRFDERTRGIALMSPDSEQAPPASLRLEVLEDGGQQRKLTVPDITF